MIGLSVVNSASKSWADRPCGCSLDGGSFIRLTTLMTRTFRSGACVRRRSTAARVSKVGTSPQQAITTSGSPPPVVAGPLPDAEASLAVLDRLIHRQPLRCRLLAGDDDVDVVPAAQAVIGDRQQAVGVGRQVDADDLGLLVGNVVDEPRVLMAKAVVVLPPDVARQPA